MKPWKALKRSLYVHNPYMKITDVLFELPNGEERNYSLTHVGRVVCVLALTPNQEIILARQFRPGPNAVLDELPGGRVEEGETPEEAVVRELQEETGYTAGVLVPLGIFHENAYSDIERHGFLALDCEPHGPQKLDEHEFIETVLKPLPEFLRQIQTGQSTDSQVAWSGLIEAGIIELPF